MVAAGGVACSSVRLIRETIIRAPDAQSPPSHHVLPLSNFDRLMGGPPVTVFYAYPKPSAAGDHASIVATVKVSLAAALAHSFPFAGQIVHNPESGEPEILCNNRGVVLIEASADISLASLDFHNLNETMQKVLLPFPCDFPLSVQIAGYTCGGFSIAWSFDHHLADGSGFIKFLSSFSELAKTNQISDGGLLDHDRSIFPPRPSPSYGPQIDKIYTVYTPDQFTNMSPNEITLKRLYYVHGSSIDGLRTEASELAPRTRTEALSAYLWQKMAGTVDEPTRGNCKIGLYVDGRERLGLAGNYMGNVVSVAFAEARTTELEDESLADVAGKVSRAVREVANREHFLELNDWVECHRPGTMVGEFILGRNAGATLVVSSCHNMPVTLAGEFGFGRPAIGFFYLASEHFGMGYVNIVSTGRDDGSWFVSMFVWPRLAAALELDPRRVFLPVVANHMWS